MKKTIKISETIKITLTNGVCRYEDVLNDFENAKHIRIVTYNISKQLETRLNTLKQLNQSTDLKIITNIPGRFEQYYGATKEKANSTIIDYIKKISPSNFANDSLSFFNFNNHSKIFATENIAYIGSANFSVESDNNFECGVLFTDKAIVEKIINELVGSIENDSILYLGKKYEEFLILIKSVFSQLTITHNKYKGLVSNEYLTAKHGEFYYDPKISKFNLPHIEDLLSTVFLLEDIHFSEQFQEVIKTSKVKYNFQRINKIVDIVSSKSSIFNFASFNFSNVVDDYMNENYIEINEETLEKFSQNSIQNANDIKENLISLCEIEFVNLFEQIEAELVSLKEIIEYLESILSEQFTINNTL